jgi:molybdopterin-binding protein
MWASGWVTISLRARSHGAVPTILKLKKGDTVVAVVKATEGMIQKD